MKSTLEKAKVEKGDLAETMKADVTAKIQELGENIIVRRFTRYEAQGPGLVASYIHLGGKVGVLVEVGCGQDATAQGDAFKELVKDITLHIAASNPQYLDRTQVPADVVASERDIYSKQVTNKPPQIIQKITDGKMEKFYGLVCLVEQGFVKDPDQSVAELLAAKGKELGDTFSIRRFVRYQVGV